VQQSVVKLVEIKFGGINMLWKMTLVMAFLVLGVANLFAQPPGAGGPPGAGDKNLGDDQVKLRSVELERVKRDAQIIEAASYAPINPKLVAQFAQIKEDYEAIQILEAAIIKAYTTGKTIDYATIETSADGIGKKALRLDENLFAATKKDRLEVKPDEKKEKPLTVRDLIIGLDNAVGNFVSSPIFGKIKVVEPDVAIKTRDDLFNVLRLSEKLAAEARKLKQP
jgi:hypothetical protein